MFAMLCSHCSRVRSWFLYTLMPEEDEVTPMTNGITSMFLAAQIVVPVFELVISTEALTYASGLFEYGANAMLMCKCFN